MPTTETITSQLTDLANEYESRANCNRIGFNDRVIKQGFTDAIRWLAEQTLLTDVASDLINDILSIVERDPDKDPTTIITNILDPILQDVWKLGGSTSPFSNLVDQAKKAAAAGILRDLNLQTR